MHDDFFRTHDFGTIIGSCRTSEKMSRWGFLIPLPVIFGRLMCFTRILYRLGSCHLSFLDESSFARDMWATKNSANLDEWCKKI